MKALKDVFCDAAGRLEIKMVLGVPTFAAAVVVLIVTRDMVVFGSLVATSLALMGITAAGDAAIDKTKAP